ncbi:MAG: glycosyltransferase [Parcubacteria group bacterium]
MIDKHPKKVLFIVTQSEYGGAQRFIFTIATNLDPKQYDVTVAFGEVGKKDFLQGALETAGIKTHRFKHLVRNANIYKDIRSVFEIRSYINNGGFDTVFLNSSKAGFNGSLATVFPSRIHKTKVIYRIGGWAFNDPRSGWQKFWIKTGERISAQWKDFIVVNCKKDFDDAERFKICPRKDIVLIHNGIDVYKTNFLEKDEARLKLSKLLEKGNLFRSKIVIGTIANFYPVKGLHHLLEAAERFKDNKNVSFVIIGDGKLRSELEETIKEKGLTHTIILAGQIPDASQYLKAFDIFAFSSLKEGFPWVVLEAMAAKLPVVTTKVGSTPEMIENNKNGFLIEPARPQQLAAKIEELIKSDHNRQEFGIQAHQTVLFKFGLDKMVEKVEALL